MDKFRNWGFLLLVLVVFLAGVHAYDQHGADDAAKASATVVYASALESCENSNPTRSAQRFYFATVAKGRFKAARGPDANDPTARAVDIEIGSAGYKTAKTYIDRPGALPSGALNCLETTKHP